MLIIRCRRSESSDSPVVEEQPQASSSKKRRESFDVSMDLEAPPPDKKAKPSKASDKGKGKEKVVVKAEQLDFTMLENGVRMADVKVGSGETVASRGNTLAIHWTGRLENGMIYDEHTTRPVSSWNFDCQHDGFTTFIDLV